MELVNVYVKTNDGTRYLVSRWKPLKGRAYYQLFKFSENENDYIYTNKDFTSIKKVNKYLNGLEK